MNNVAELLRLIQNLVRLGTIAEIDHDAARVRVKSGDLLTAWVPWLTARAGNTRDWNPPTVGEQAVVFSPGGDTANAIAMPGIYQNAHPAPSSNPALIGRWYPDGAVIEYDHINHHLRATLPGSAEITAPGGALLNADTTINGRLSINGNSVTHNGINIGDTHIHVCPSCRGITTGPS